MHQLSTYRSSNSTFIAWPKRNTFITSICIICEQPMKHAPPYRKRIENTFMLIAHPRCRRAHVLFKAQKGRKGYDPLPLRWFMRDK